MNQIIRYSFLAVACLPMAVAAQTATAVSPKAAATIGNSDNVIPYAYYPSRYQQIHDYGTFIGSTAVTVKSVNHRMSSGSATGKLGGQVVTLSMWMAYTPQGATPITSQNPSNTFAKNLDSATLVQVVKNKAILLPKLNNYGFGIKIPFSQPFMFSSALKKSLVIETRVYGNNFGNNRLTYPLDAWSGINVGAGSATTNGSYLGCMAKDATRVSHFAVDSWLTIGYLRNYSYGYGRASGLLAVMTFGARNLDITLSGTNCKIVNDPILLFPGYTMSGSNGYFRVNLPIPNDSKLLGVLFKTQMFFFEKGANSLGLTSTRGLDQKIGPGKPANMISITRVWASGNTQIFDPDKVTSGGINKDYGLVTQITN